MFVFLFEVVVLSALAARAALAQPSDPCYTAHTDQKSCDGDISTGGGCVWCKCAALPSSCWTKANSKKLPPAVYQCGSSKDSGSSSGSQSRRRAAAAFTHCGAAVDDTLLPDTARLFFEHDEAGTNRLQSLELDHPAPTPDPDTVLTAGNMVFGGPSADYAHAALYLMHRSSDGASVHVSRHSWLDGGATVHVMTEPAANFAALKQAPAQFPAAYNPADERFYWYMKYTGGRGRIYALDVSESARASTQTLNDATVVFEDEADCVGRLDCLIMGTLTFAQLRVDCAGSLWFNTGRSLTRYSNLADALADGDAGVMATREVVVSRDWLQDNDRCLKTDASCRIKGFALDTTANHTDATPVWFTYSVAYSSALAYDSIWKCDAQVTGTGSPANAVEVYKKIHYELQDYGQFLGAIELDPTALPAPTLLVNTYKQNSGARSVIRLPQSPAGPGAANSGNANSWSGGGRSVNLFGFSASAPFKAEGDVLIGARDAECASLFWNTQLGCGATETALTLNCGSNCAGVKQWRYPAQGSPALVLVPGKTRRDDVMPTCPADSPVMAAAAAVAGVPANCDSGSPSSFLPASQTDGRYVVYAMDKPFASTSSAGYGLRVVIDDGRLPHRRTVNGRSQWTTWQKDIPLPNAAAAASIIGPVVDRARRELLYLKSDDCDGPGGTCTLWKLVSYSLATREETILYQNTPWEFPTTIPIFTGTFAGRSVMAYDEKTRTVWLTAVPRNSVKELKLYSVHLGADSTSADAQRLGGPTADRGLKHCQVRLRYTFDRQDHTAYNGMSANCDGTVHLAINGRLWRYDAQADQMTDLSATADFANGMEAVGLSKLLAIRAVATSAITAGTKWLFFASGGLGDAGVPGRHGHRASVRARAHARPDRHAAGVH